MVEIGGRKYNIQIRNTANAMDCYDGWNAVISDEHGNAIDINTLK